MGGSRMKCNQCGKPAVVYYEQDGSRLGLCLDCNLKFQQANEIQWRRLAEHMNYLASEIEMSLGMSGFMPRYPAHQSVIHQGEFKLNNININNSIVGAVNTGTVQSIDLSLSIIKNHGNNEIAQAIKEITEKIIESSQLNDSQRNEVLEQLSFISEQITKPKEQRSASILKPIASAIASTLSGFNDLLNLWDKLKTLLGI